MEANHSSRYRRAPSRIRSLCRPSLSELGAVFAAVFLAFFIPELAIRACDEILAVPAWALFCSAWVDGSFAAAFTLLISMLPSSVSRKIAAGLSVAISAAFTVVALIEICVRAYFGNYFLFGYIRSMTADVAGQFGGTVFQLILSNFGVIFLLVLFCVADAVLLVLMAGGAGSETLKDLVHTAIGKIRGPAAFSGSGNTSRSMNGDTRRPSARHVSLQAADSGTAAAPGGSGTDPRRYSTGTSSQRYSSRSVGKRRLPYPVWVYLIVIWALSSVLNFAACRLSGGWKSLHANFNANEGISSVGLANTLELEAFYSIFGYPETTLGTDESQNDAIGEAGDETGSTEDTTVYSANVLNIDFSALSESTDSDTLKSMDAYFSSQNPTSQNKYTGLFQSKNLIMICAEAFSYAIIDPELTPALYRLTTTGFVTENFYQPDWSQSTTGGEFALMTGIYPTWIGSELSFDVSVGDTMAYGLGWIFKALGYTARAYHNNIYTYYNRDKTHPNLGYDYYGIGNGLELPNNVWPNSDLEMLEATIPAGISDYLTTGTPFHFWYMSVSGHAGYDWEGNMMAWKNRDAVADLPYSELVKGYIAAQLELEYALEYLLEALEEAGIAEDTVIVMCADHYPYALSESYDQDYYKELTGIDDDAYDTSRYQNALILWSGCIEEPIYVDTPCTAVDVVPTLLNLFGVEYDSRLLSGRDILQEDVEPGVTDSSMNIAIVYNFSYGLSWITRAGTYESKTGTFIPAEGVVLEDEAAYVSAVSGLAANRYSYAQQLIAQNYYAHVFPNWAAGKSLTSCL